MPVIKPFETPQRQSPVGILLIFGTSVYKSLRAFWVVGAYIIFGKMGGDYLAFIILGIVVFALATLIFSYFSYRRFQFNIDYDSTDFVLKKGVFSTSQTVIPFDKIQQVYFKRSILQRIINVYEVVIDTAGSSQDEVKIKALSKEQALLLQEVLLREAKNEENERNENSITESAETANEERTEGKTLKSGILWRYSISFSTLLKLGLTTNYFRGVWILVLFVGSLLQQVDNQVLEQNLGGSVEDFVGNTSTMLDRISQWGIIAFPLLLILGIVITSIEIFTKYYNLQLTQTQENLELEMGLRTQTRVALKPRRVQVLSVTTNLLQERLNLYQIQLALASSAETSDKNKVKIPGLSAAIVGKVKKFLFGITAEHSMATFRPHRLLLIRKWLFGILPLILGIALWYSFLEFFYWETVLPVSLVYLAIMFPYQYFMYRSIVLSFSEGFLIKKYGLWQKTVEIIPLYKLQATTVKQPFWYKKRALFTLVFHTASGDISFAAIDGKALNYINYSLYSIETSRKDWM